MDSPLRLRPSKNLENVLVQVAIHLCPTGLLGRSLSGLGLVAGADRFPDERAPLRCTPRGVNDSALHRAEIMIGLLNGGADGSDLPKTQWSFNVLFSNLVKCGCLTASPTSPSEVYGI